MPNNAIETYFKNPKHQLANVIDRVNQLRVFNQSFLGILDQKIAKHCEIVNIKDNCLTIIADSSPWATKIRFQSADILKKLTEKKEFKAISSLKILIRPRELLIKGKKTQKKASKLTEENAEMIYSIAEYVENIHLKKALKNLAGKNND